MKTKLSKILLYAAIGGVLLLGVTYAGWHTYKSVRQTRLIKQARQYMAKPDPRKALLCLQRALRYDSKDIEATRLMAELNDAGRLPAALKWRSRLVELNPRSVEDRVALAETAIAFRNYMAATNALEGVDAAGKKTAVFHQGAGDVAMAVNRSAQAEAHFLEAARLEPANAIIQLKLAAIRLDGTNVQTLNEARSTLGQISSNPTNSLLRCYALRILTTDAMRSRQSERAIAMSKQLLRETNSVFGDRLLQLDVLHEAKSPELKSVLADLKHTAATNAGHISMLGAWLLTRNSPTEALTWERSLSPIMQTNQLVGSMTAECYLTKRDWPGLLAFLETQNWDDTDFLRHALKARALREQGLKSAAKAEWDLAQTPDQKGRFEHNQLLALYQLAAKWNWETEGEELLWNTLNRAPGEKWAFPILSDTLYRSGRTQALLKLYRQELKRSPNNLRIKNDLAMVAFLLDAAEVKPHDLAHELYKINPTNATYASTYAFSLHREQKDAEALKIFLTLKPQDLQQPSIAGYYGLVLKAVGSKEKARAYLDWACRAPLLPEEKKLFDQARLGI